MTNAVTRRLPAPLYYRVETWLRQYLARDGLAPGTWMAIPEAVLRQLGVSRITVRRAMERLVQEGLISRVPARGGVP
ncbi:MAG: GntR family transcriptional regulator [Armatimonadota bacterium]|nr:GntR family transcriptional regulator [Armatimonadota bacterium]